MNARNGASCGNNLYCSNGTCSPCTPNVSCTTSVACKTGTTSCATGTSVCNVSGDLPDGRDCGQGRVCRGGACVACTARDNVRALGVQGGHHHLRFGQLALHRRRATPPT